MNTVILQKAKFERIQQRANLYEVILKNLPERKWGIESYSPSRMREFMQKDNLNPKTRAQIKRLISR